MRQTISGLIAAVAVVMAASAAPAMACGGGLFQGSCSPCGQSYVSPCAQSYYEPAPVPEPVPVPAPVYSGCNSCNSGWAYERLPDPMHQYYYADQGPTYTGPGDFAPRPSYQEDAISNEGYYRHHPFYSHYSHYSHWRAHTGYHYGYRYGAGRYGYEHHHGYVSHYSLPPRQFYGERHNMRYGGMMAPHYYSQREHMHRTY